MKIISVLFLIFNTAIVFGMQNSVIGTHASLIKRTPSSLKFLAAKACSALPQDRLPVELKEYARIASVKDYRSCLIEACKTGNNYIVQDMICLGVDLDEKHSDRRETPLALSAEYGHASCVELLLCYGARDTYTAALVAAVRHNKPQCIEVLCRNPEPIYLMGDCYGVGNDNPEALMALFQHLPSAAKPHKLEHAAHCYVRGNTTNPACLALLLDRGININVTSAYEWVSERTLLMEAVQYRKREMIQLLLTRSADVNLRNSMGYTALMTLIGDRSYYRGNDKMDEFKQVIVSLVQRGAQMNDQDLNKALASCNPEVREGWKEAIRKMIAGKSDIE